MYIRTDRQTTVTLLHRGLIISHLANFAEGFGVLSNEVQAEWSV